MAETFDQHISAANSVFDAMQGSLQGAGPLFQEFQSIAAQVRQIPNIGSQAADNLKAILDDPSLPQDVKHSRTTKIGANVEHIVTTADRDVRARLDAFERGLLEAVLPPPLSDSKSLLVRQELELLINAMRPVAKPGDVQRPVPSLLAIFTDFAEKSQNLDHLSEILGAWGQAQMVASGEKANISALRNNIAKRVADSPGGNPVIKGALKALPQVRGHVMAYTQAAKFRAEQANPTNQGKLNALKVIRNNTDARYI